MDVPPHQKNAAIVYPVTTRKNASMLSFGSRPVFLAGVVTGAVLTAAVWLAFNNWSPERKINEINDWKPVTYDEMYDRCLVDHGGNTTLCEAFIRIAKRIAQPLKERVARWLSAGFSKREIAEYEKTQGVSDAQLAAALGISLSDLQAGKY
jgi:hypothetical protein